jgi:hypothetical protein
MIRLIDTETGATVGTITDAQLEFLMDQLEEESDEDQDYYLTVDTIDAFEEAGAEPALLTVLRNAIGERDEMEIRWARD